MTDLAVPTKHSVNIKESEKKDKFLDLNREIKKSCSDSSYNWCAWNDLQRFGKKTERTGKKRTNQEPPEYSMVEIA